MNDLKNVTFA